MGRRGARRSGRRRLSGLPRDFGSSNFGHGLWPFGSFRGFVMGKGRCSRPTVEVGVPHVGCAEDVTMFVALAVAVDLSMDACRLFSCKLRRELLASSAELLR
ncbi:uncharacterized protein C2845_PM03G17330 [Panicum miliaceum]|uniref:Uncharacterized protein n=1 Tax=Panicum miliaceum TaxID=4540 RepID=A0A3L6TFU2_PANMI|nr:uncharacterized protein C2845_PM03G17330 [Panicum miliaceum]